MNNTSILDILVTQGNLTAEQKEQVVELANSNALTIENALKQKAFVSDEDIAQAKAMLFDMQYQDLAEIDLTTEALHVIPEDIANNYRLVCFAIDEKEIFIGLTNPQNLKALEAVEFLAKENGYKPRYYIVSNTALDTALKKYKALGEEVEEVLQVAEERFKEDVLDTDIQPLGEAVKKAPVSKIVNSVLKDAIDAHASDIHIEPAEDGTRVRYRVDGILKTTLTLPSYIHSSVVSRIKVLANLKLDETRKPQDGRIKMTIGKSKVDMRVSVLPMVDAEKVVMRVLDTTGKILKLSDLGFRQQFVEIFDEVVSKPHGLFLVTGPTGAGKSTTLYSTLGLLNQEGVNVSTLEDPVEKFIKGVNQSQVNPEVGYTFAAGLRALLRQDPDVIMVGEIRDGETAELAVHAALTGHVVFSTLHTNDAIGAIPRLIDMGVEPFLIVSTVEMIQAQRLVRTICDACKKSVELPPKLQKVVKDDLAEINPKYLPEGFEIPETISTYESEGCPECNGQAYKGRTTIAEVIVMTEELAEAITHGNEMSNIHDALKKQGVLTMRQDGILKALEGVTTIQEVLRVMQE